MFVMWHDFVGADIDNSILLVMIYFILLIYLGIYYLDQNSIQVKVYNHIK